MSFGFSIGDFILLTQLANTTVQNARKACGTHDAITQEIKSLHTVLRGLETEVSKPESILNKPGDNRTKGLSRLARGCKKVLKVLSQVLNKYNALSDEKRSVTKLWQRIKFGNDEMLDMGEIRSQLTTYTQAITMFLNLMSIGSQGKVELYMESHSEELREIKESLNWVTASMQANSHEEGSILTSYAEDDKVVWKSFRRELIKEGFSSRTLGKHKRTIIKYVLELGERGALDEIEEGDGEEEDHPTANDEESTSSEDPAIEIELQESEEEGSDSGLDEIASPDSETNPRPSVLGEQELNVIETASEPDASPTSIGTSLVDRQNILGNGETREATELDICPVQDSSNPHPGTSASALREDTNIPVEKEARMEDVVDEDFLPEAHPNCLTVSDEGDQEASSDLPLNTCCDRQEYPADAIEDFSTDDECLLPTVSPIANSKRMVNYTGSLFPNMRPDSSPSSESGSISSSESDGYRRPEHSGATVASDDTRIISARQEQRQRLSRRRPFQICFRRILDFHENSPIDIEDIGEQHINIYKNSELSMKLAKGSAYEHELVFPAPIPSISLKPWTRGIGWRIFISDGKSLHILYRQDENLIYTEARRNEQWEMFMRLQDTAEHLRAKTEMLYGSVYAINKPERQPIYVDDDDFTGQYMRATKSNVNRGPLNLSDPFAHTARTPRQKYQGNWKDFTGQNMQAASSDVNQKLQDYVGSGGMPRVNYHAGQRRKDLASQYEAGQDTQAAKSKAEQKIQDFLKFGYIPTEGQHGSQKRNDFAGQDIATARSKAEQDIQQFLGTGYIPTARQHGSQKRNDFARQDIDAARSKAEQDIQHILETGYIPTVRQHGSQKRTDSAGQSTQAAKAKAKWRS